MRSFDAKRGAAFLLGVSALYLVLSLALGRSARSEPPPDLSAGTEAGLDVWKAAAALLDPEQALAVDVRPAEEYARYHLPGAVSSPGAEAARIRALARGRRQVIVVASKDEVARKLVGEASAADPETHYQYLQDGPRSWYLAFDLPVPIFSEAAAPRGYDEAVARVRAFFQAPTPEARPRALESIQALVKAGYGPTLLKQSGKPKAVAAKKKIAGGCGG